MGRFRNRIAAKLRAMIAWRAPMRCSVQSDVAADLLKVMLCFSGQNNRFGRSVSDGYFVSSLSKTTPVVFVWLSLSTRSTLHPIDHLGCGNILPTALL